MQPAWRRNYSIGSRMPSAARLETCTLRLSSIWAIPVEGETYVHFGPRADAVRPVAAVVCAGRRADLADATDQDHRLAGRRRHARHHLPADQRPVVDFVRTAGRGREPPGRSECGWCHGGGARTA